MPSPLHPESPPMMRRLSYRCRAGSAVFHFLTEITVCGIASVRLDEEECQIRVKASIGLTHHRLMSSYQYQDNKTKQVHCQLTPTGHAFPSICTLNRLFPMWALVPPLIHSWGPYLRRNTVAIRLISRESRAPSHTRRMRTRHDGVKVII